MLTKFTLALGCVLLLPMQIALSAPPTPQKTNAVLCKTEAQAIAFASRQAEGNTEPMAIYYVNKAAGTEVCGRYQGYAVVEVQKTTNYQGGLYMLAGFRFEEDGALRRQVG